MRLGIKPTVAGVFKTIFGSEEHRGVTTDFLNAILEREGGWFRSYALRDPKDGIILCADAAILIIELSRWAKEHALKAGPILGTELDRWLCFLWKGEEMDPEQAQGGNSNERIREALETMAVFTKSEAARDLYRRRMEYRMEQASIRAEDREAGMAEGRALGLAEGKAEGRALGLEEGRQEGEAEALRAVASRLKREGLDPDLIARATGLTKEKIEALDC